VERDKAEGVSQATIEVQLPQMAHQDLEAGKRSKAFITELDGKIAIDTAAQIALSQPRWKWLSSPVFFVTAIAKENQAEPVFNTFSRYQPGFVDASGLASRRARRAGKGNVESARGLTEQRRD
jgi:hypothetical protein